MELIILGCGSAVPTLWRNPSAQILSFEDAHYLIDCAEGTQVRFLENKIKPKYLRAVFISHLHGDHYLGLMGLLWTLELSGRTKRLKIVCPKGLKTLIDIHLELANSQLQYEVDFMEVDPGKTGKVYSDDRLEVEFFPLEHGVACAGMKFTEIISRRNVNPEAIERLNLSNDQIKMIIHNEEVLGYDGQAIDREHIFLPEREPRTYCYCTDTVSLDSTVDHVSGCDLLYHEATYEHEFLEKAVRHKHSTTIQAAEIANRANVKRLVVGHFSSRYREVDYLLAEVKSVFADSIAAEDGLRINIG